MRADYATTSPGAEVPRPCCSVIVPVLGEAACIGRALAALGLAARAAPDMAVEAVVVDGDAGGSTLRAMPGHVSGLAGLRGLTAPRGRARQMNAGAAAAQGDVLLFLHADTLLPESAFTAVRRALHSGARAGAFSLRIDSPRAALRLIAAVATLRSRLLGLPLGDQGLFVRREDFARLGGFADLPLMEDADLVRRLCRAGLRPRILAEAARTSPRRWERQGALFCTLRNWSLLALWGLGVSEARLARFYRPLQDPAVPERETP